MTAYEIFKYWMETTKAGVYLFKVDTIESITDILDSINPIGMDGVWNHGDISEMFVVAAEMLTVETANELVELYVDHLDLAHCFGATPCNFTEADIERISQYL